MSDKSTGQPTVGVNIIKQLGGVVARNSRLSLSISTIGSHDTKVHNRRKGFRFCSTTLRAENTLSAGLK